MPVASKTNHDSGGWTGLLKDTLLILRGTAATFNAAAAAAAKSIGSGTVLLLAI